MLGLDLLMAGLISLSPTPIVADINCQAKTAPQINIVPSQSHVQYDFTKSKAELNSIDVDTVSPYGPKHKTTVSGLMSGAIQIKHEVGFMHEKYYHLGTGCVYLKSVDVKIHIDPTVYIASEYPKGSCYHNAVLAHERKHVNEDQMIVNRYTNIIGRALGALVDSRGPAFGPYPIEQLPEIQKNIQNSLTDVVKKYNKKMNEERRERQQAIDNLEEYESIGKRCKEERG